MVSTILVIVYVNEPLTLWKAVKMLKISNTRVGYLSSLPKICVDKIMCRKIQM
jgi:hypothetical protein